MDPTIDIITFSNLKINLIPIMIAFSLLIGFQVLNNTFEQSPTYLLGNNFLYF